MRTTRSILAAAAILAWSAPHIYAQIGSSLTGKTITMIVGFAPGGGTDVIARWIGAGFTKYLPGNPTFIVKNIPGAEGMTSMNYVTQQVKADGLTVVLGSSSQADPMNYRSGNSKYDPAAFPIVGGMGRGGTFTLISTAAENRLHDKKRDAIVMGSNAGIPRNGMQMALWGIEYLGWNAKWVVGYPGTKAILLALERGEVDMTATGNMLEFAAPLKSGKVKVLTQSGALENGKMVPRKELADAPLLVNLVREKIDNDPAAQAAFQYWMNIISVDKFLALPPGTPSEIVQIYQAAYEKLMDAKEFLAQGKAISEDIDLLTPPEVERVIKALAATSNSTIEYTKRMMRKQGLKVE